MIYFIYHDGHIKIGSSVDPWKRLSSLQTAHHAPLEMLAVMPGEASDEHKLHQRFGRCRKHGEWFRDDRMLRQYIDEVRSCYPDLQKHLDEKSAPAVEREPPPYGEIRQMYNVKEISKAYSSFDLFVRSGGRAEYDENNEMFWLGLPEVRWVGGDDPTMRYVVDYDSGQVTVRIGRESKPRTLTDRINEAMMSLEYFFSPPIFYREDYGIDITFRKIAESTTPAVA